MNSTRQAEPLLVTGLLEFDSSVDRDMVVKKGGVLRVRGNLRGNLTIEQGGNVEVEGTIEGGIANKGGKLVVGNREFAETSIPQGPPEAEAGGVLGINLSALTRNWSLLGRRAAAACGAVIKADAYGCGIEMVAAALAKFGCRIFFVSDLAEAKRVRATAPDSIIYVLSGVFPGIAAAFAEVNARPVIGSLVELAEWDAFVASSQWSGGFALNVDTGASRSGLSVEEAASIASRIGIATRHLELVMSHLDHGRIADHPQTERQARVFQDLCRSFQGIAASLAGSSGIFLDSKVHFDLVRAGSALFGVNPMPGRSHPMRPVVDLRARIVQVRSLPPGAALASPTAWTAKRPTRLALISVGYGDGFPRPGPMAGRGQQVVIAGTRCPLVGHIDTDLLAVDATEVRDQTKVCRGEMATLVGGPIDIDDVASVAGSTAAEVLANLGNRFHRRYYQTDHVAVPDGVVQP